MGPALTGAGRQRQDDAERSERLKPEQCARRPESRGSRQQAHRPREPEHRKKSARYADRRSSRRDAASATQNSHPKNLGDRTESKRRTNKAVASFLRHFTNDGFTAQSRLSESTTERLSNKHETPVALRRASRSRAAHLFVYSAAVSTCHSVNRSASKIDGC
jgi:hypothetical protein